MGKVNFPRVVLGGLLAGIVVNVSEFVLNELVIKEQSEAAMKALGKTMPNSPAVMTTWILWGFAAGIVSVWLYAAIRPRYGPGPGTAVRAGLATWFIGWFLSMVAMQNMGLFPISPVTFVWTLAESVISTMAGAWLYREA
ncbi:MAG: hypothetical protein ACM3NW_07320 [Syntrophomonadaceae bacterium]